MNFDKFLDRLDEEESSGPLTRGDADKIAETHGLDKGKLNYNGEHYTTKEHWNCGCSKHFIHPTEHDSCPKCKQRREGSPYSKVQEFGNPENLYSGK